MNKESIKKIAYLLIQGLLLSALVFIIGTYISPGDAILASVIITLAAFVLVIKKKEIKNINSREILILLSSSLLISIAAFIVRASVPPGISANIIFRYLCFSMVIGFTVFVILIAPTAYATMTTGTEKLSMQLSPFVAAILFVDLTIFAVLNIKNDFIILLALTITLNTVIGIILIICTQIYYEKISIKNFKKTL